MKVSWQHTAIADLASIRTYISQQNPYAADSVVARILSSVERLDRFPASGRSGSVPETREIVVPGLPYIVVYTLAEGLVTIVGVFHGAREYPG